jgi:hypothetical protein
VSTFVGVCYADARSRQSRALCKVRSNDFLCWCYPIKRQLTVLFSLPLFQFQRATRSYLDPPFQRLSDGLVAIWYVVICGVDVHGPVSVEDHPGRPAPVHAGKIGGQECVLLGAPPANRRGDLVN